MLRFIEFFCYIFIAVDSAYSLEPLEWWSGRNIARKSNEIVGEKNQPEVMSCTFSSIRFCCALTWCQAYLLDIKEKNFLLAILHYYSITWTEGMDIFIVCFLNLLTLTEIYNILLKIIHPSRRAKWAAVGGTLEFLFFPPIASPSSDDNWHNVLCLLLFFPVNKIHRRLSFLISTLLVWIKNSLKHYYLIFIGFICCALCR